MSRPASSKPPVIDLNDKYDKADILGTLIVVLLKARNLNDKHSFRKSDVFAQAILNGVQKRTHVDYKGGQHPEWDGEVRFPILKTTGAKFRTMEVACFSLEPRSEDLMGKATVDISETVRTGEFDDWVQLEVDGVARGELYLEMTYYANAPAPTPVPSNKLLSTVINQNAGLSRRPSKLAPADRLSRPQQAQPSTQGPTQGYPQNQPQGNLPSKYTPTHASRLSDGYTPARQDTPILPGSYPISSNTSPNRTPYNPESRTNEISYGGVVPSPRPGDQGGQQQQNTAALPTILRPGVGGSGASATPVPRPQNGLNHIRHPSDPSLIPNAGRPQGSPPTHNPYLASSSNPYISGTPTPTEVQRPGVVASPPNAVGSTITSPVQGQNPYSGYRLGGQLQGVTPLLWQQDNSASSTQSSFAFPTPSITPTPAYTNNIYPTHSRRPSGPLAPYNPLYGPSPPSRDDRHFDPHRLARYQTPLPLPPGTDRQAASDTPAKYQTPAPQPESVQGSQPIYHKAPTPPPKTTTPALDQTRLNALRWAEEDAARRREQELKDLELAMQLDRELNLAEGR